MILWVKPNFVGTARSPCGNRRDGAEVSKWRLRITQVKYLHNAVGIIGPKVIVRSDDDTAWAHSLRRPAGVIGQTYSMKTTDSPQEQIVFGVENINAGISRFSQVAVSYTHLTLPTIYS